MAIADRGQALTVEKVKPAALPYERAALVLAGTVVPVDVQRVEERPGDVAFRLVAHGQLVEEERYRLETHSFSIVSAAGESYKPPIPLLANPIEAKKPWVWQGSLTSGVEHRNARADLVAIDERLNLPGGPYDSIRVDVELSIEGVGPQPAKRKLAFWFAPGKGIVKRDFGSSSTRAPLSEEP